MKRGLISVATLPVVVFTAWLCGMYLRIRSECTVHAQTGAGFCPDFGSHIPVAFQLGLASVAGGLFLFGLFYVTGVWPYSRELPSTRERRWRETSYRLMITCIIIDAVWATAFIGMAFWPLRQLI